LTYLEVDVAGGRRGPDVITTRSKDDKPCDLPECDRPLPHGLQHRRGPRHGAHERALLERGAENRLKFVVGVLLTSFGAFGRPGRRRRMAWRRPRDPRHRRLSRGLSIALTLLLRRVPRAAMAHQ
jgi:hypothetical protein